MLNIETGGVQFSEGGEMYLTQVTGEGFPRRTGFEPTSLGKIKRETQPSELPYIQIVTFFYEVPVPFPNPIQLFKRILGRDNALDWARRKRKQKDSKEADQKERE